MLTLSRRLRIHRDRMANRHKAYFVVQRSPGAASLWTLTFDSYDRLVKKR